MKPWKTTSKIACSTPSEALQHPLRGPRGPCPPERRAQQGIGAMQIYTAAPAASASTSAQRARALWTGQSRHSHSQAWLPHSVPGDPEGTAPRLASLPHVAPLNAGPQNPAPHARSSETTARIGRQGLVPVLEIECCHPTRRVQSPEGCYIRYAATYVYAYICLTCHGPCQSDLLTAVVSTVRHSVHIIYHGQSCPTLSSAWHNISMYANKQAHGFSCRKQSDCPLNNNNIYTVYTK